MGKLSVETIRGIFNELPENGEGSLAVQRFKQRLRGTVQLMGGPKKIEQIDADDLPLPASSGLLNGVGEATVRASQGRKP